jgi:hypothetical protein
MYPEHHDVLMGGNSVQEIEKTNEIVNDLLVRLEKNYNVKSDYYTVQSLLCEYKQSVLAKKQFPGKSIDSELSYMNKVALYWGEDFKKQSIMWDIRKKIFPIWSLGELNGWENLREELGSVLVDYGYTWSDQIYDYHKTITTFGGFRQPVFRNQTRKSILNEIQ